LAVKLPYNKPLNEWTDEEKNELVGLQCGKKRTSTAKRNARNELVKLHQAEFNTLVKKYTNAATGRPVGVKAS